MDKPTPAVIFKLSFMQKEDNKWYIGQHDLLDYMDKPEKFLVKSGLNISNKRDYLDYMNNPDKSLGVFDDKTDVYSAADKERFRALEQSSKEQGCPKYVGVLSFDNAFLEANGYMHNGTLDDERMRDVARAAIAEMIDKSKKLDNDNVYYAASVHKNTDNIHVHYSVLEYEFREDRTVTYKNAGKNEIELEAIFAAKSKAANMIASKRNKAQYAELHRLQRELLLPKLATSFSNTTADVYNLAAQLPPDKHWQYNRPRMRQYHAAINSCIDSIIKSSPELRRLWSEYISSLNSMQDYYKYLYGVGDLHLYSEYKVKRLQDFYSRAGQSLLNFIKSAGFSEKVSDSIPAVAPDDSDAQPKFILISDDRGADLSEEELSRDIIDIADDYSDVEIFDAHLSEEKTADELRVRWSKAYKTATEYFYGTNEIEQDLEQARELFLDEHNNGNLLATFMLGKLYSAKPYHDEEKSKEYYLKAYKGMTSPLPLLNDRMQQYVNYKLGAMAEHGLGIEQNHELAFKYYTAAGDYPCALYNLGKLYQLGNGVERSDEKAFECFQRAYLLDKKNRMPHNTYALAKCYEKGQGSATDERKAEMYYTEAFQEFESSEKQSPNDFIQYRLGLMYYDGKGVTKDIAKSIEYLKKSAENDNVPAHILLGRIYTEAEDYDTAIAYLSAEPVADNMQAKYMLGKLYLNLNDEANAEECFRYAADNDNEYAQYSLGKLLYSQERFDEALEYLRRSADRHGNQFAQYALGKHFLSDRFYDERSAENYLLRSAMQDNEYGQYALGKLYLKQGHITDALEWLHKAADEHGNEFAQLQLGSLYYTYKYGSSIHDRQKGEYYLRLSSEQGNTFADRLLKTTFRPKGVSLGRRSPRYNTAAARADLAKAKHIADSVYADMMSHLAELQREFERENNVVESGYNYTY